MAARFSVTPVADSVTVAVDVAFDDAVDIAVDIAVDVGIFLLALATLLLRFSSSGRLVQSTALAHLLQFFVATGKQGWHFAD